MDPLKNMVTKPKYPKLPKKQIAQHKSYSVSTKKRIEINKYV